MNGIRLQTGEHSKMTTVRWAWYKVGVQREGEYSWRIARDTLTLIDPYAVRVGRAPTTVSTDGGAGGTLAWLE